jgi:hypothetical protein
MRPTFTRQQAADAVAKATGERDAIRANLLDLDSSFGKRLLEGAALTGITRQRWDSAAASLAALWQLFDAYWTVIDRAAKILSGRLGQEKLAKITALLTGPSIELHRPAPFGERDLADTGREQVSITTGRARMSAAFAEVTAAAAAAHTARENAIAVCQRAAARITAVPEVPADRTDLHARVAALDTLLAGGRWTRLSAEFDLLERELASAAGNFRATERAVVALLSRRDELRGLLDAYQAKAARLGAAEDPHLAARCAQARELLWTAPCDLTAVASAVNGYQQAVLAIGARQI